MKNWFNKISLRWKLALVTVLATAVALVMTGVIMAAYDARTYESQKVGAITSDAEILGASVAAALVFEDAAAAQEYLQALDANPEIVAAAVYDLAGKMMASYERAGTREWSIPESAEKRGYNFQDDELGVFVPVMQDKAAIGSVYLKAIVEPVGVRLARYIGVLLLIGAGAMGIALPISLWLHRLISNPIEELAARNEIIKATLDSVEHGVVVVDGDMRIAFLNDRIAALFHAALPNMTQGMDFESLMQGAKSNLGLSDRRHENDVASLRLSEHARGQYLLPDGKTVEYRQAPLPRGGFVRTYTDISEEKLFHERLQQAKTKAEDAAQAKSNFLAAMSHEIRTPMSGVIGIVELLRSTNLTDEQKQMVELVQRSGIGLLDVINDILDYSKIEAGRMTVERTDCALAEIVETTAEVIGSHTQSKTLNVLCLVDPMIDPVVKGDPVRIRQIILNLMGNAVKFTETGTVAIEAKVESVSSERIAVMFEVSDTGMGIEEDKQRQLFQPFSQADYSTTRKFGGTGLGLSISKNLVELMHGEIGVQSEVGKGSTFWFRVPFERLPESERPAVSDEYDGILAGLRILVYDPAAPRSAPSRYLRAAKVEVLEFTDHAEAIACLRTEADAGRKLDAAVVCFRIGDAHAGLVVEETNHLRHRTVRTVVIAPNLSGSVAKIANAQNPMASLSAPIRRDKFYDAIATVVGRVPRRALNAAANVSFNFAAPSVDEALAQGCLILVAEDNQTNQFVIKSQMRRLGFAAEFVNDGREAWETLTRNEGRYGLLITDCHMPFVDGYQLTGLIRDREKMSGRHLPVVALTANALQGESEICSAAGMDGYLSKPTDLATLDAMVQKWLPQAATARRPLAVPVASINGDAVGIALHETKPTLGHMPPIDTAILGNLLGSNDPAYLREMLSLFLSTEQDTPSVLRDLATARDSDNLGKAAHAAKGAAISAGAQRLAQLFKDLERNAKAGEWKVVDTLSSEVEVAFDEVRQFIKAF